MNELTSYEQVDRSTIISVFPFEIREHKPGLYPGSFIIPASVDGKPKCMQIGTSVHYVILGDDRPSIAVKTPSFEVARSVVDDFIDGQLVCTPGEAQPGLAWTVGALTQDTIEMKHKDLLHFLRDVQFKWFRRLVDLATDDYKRYKNTRVISDIQRFAARALGYQDKVQWITEVPNYGESPVKCPACKTVYPFGTVVCAACRCVIDKVEFAKLQFTS